MFFFFNFSVYNLTYLPIEFKVLNELDGPNISSKVDLSDSTILDSWGFKIFILADEPFTKAIQNLKACLLANNNYCKKLASLLESPTTFDERFRVTSVPIFICNFNLF